MSLVRDTPKPNAYGNGRPRPQGGRRGYRVTGLLGLGTGPPRRATGVVQHAFTTFPEACPKCHGAAALVANGREASCRGYFGGCGWTGYLVRPESTGSSCE
jgi:hypothetical protein